MAETVELDAYSIFKWGLVSYAELKELARKAGQPIFYLGTILKPSMNVMNPWWRIMARKGIRLVVGIVKEYDVGKKYVRIKKRDREKIGVKPDDLIRVQAKEDVVVKAAEEYENQKNGSILMDGNLRAMLGTDLRKGVTVCKANMKDKLSYHWKEQPLTIIALAISVIAFVISVISLLFLL